MIYLTVSILVFSIVIIFIHSTQRNARQSRRAQIRQQWGRPKRVDFNFHRIGRYAEGVTTSYAHKLSTQTLTDLDFEVLFSFIDRTTSAIGQQFLFRRLIYPSQSLEELTHLNSLADQMTNDETMREEIQEELKKLDQPSAYNLCNLIHLNPEKKPGWFRFLYISLILIPIFALLSLYSYVFLVLLLIPVTVNVGIHYWHRSQTAYSMYSYAEVGVLLSVSRAILKTMDVTNPVVEASLRDINKIKWRLYLLYPGKAAMKDDLSQFGFYINELINGIFLIEIMTVTNLSKALRRRGSPIRTLFDFIGEVDTAISIASLRAGHKDTCKPVFLEKGKNLNAKGIYHPLIANCISNDITVKDHSVLITGSNMSGKTTFLRTMIINSILAQSIYTCFAEEFSTPFMRQFSSIRIDDDLFEGRSYFFEEVNVIGLFIEAMQSGHQNLFVLDEVFRGTNSIERTALAKAVLSFLNRGDNIVIVSSHDVELADLLRNEYNVYHFTESIENRQLYFDHQLRPGPLRTRNAIRLLELGEFPSEIISEARELSSLRLPDLNTQI